MSIPGTETMRGPGAVSVMVFTLDEEIHLGQCLDALKWCDDVIVVDSFSSDRTEAICRELGVRFFQNRFEGFGVQRNWALENTSPRHPWILILDADERATPDLIDELEVIAASDPPHMGAYRVRRRFHLWGRWLKHSSLYPTWVVRFIRLGRVRYVNRGHAETQEVDGEIGNLAHDLIDENLKGMDEWFVRQNRYSRKDAEFELDEEKDGLKMRELISIDPLRRRAALKRLSRRVPFRGTFYFLYSYILRLGFLDGHDGLVLCRMRALYQTQVEAKKYDIRKRCDRAKR